MQCNRRFETTKKARSLPSYDCVTTTTALFKCIAGSQTLSPISDRRFLHAFTMNAADFDELSESEQKHFYQCTRCGEMVDMRQLDDVLFHEKHVHRPDIQYGGSEEL